MKSKVYVRIPSSGLGNCMLVWAHGFVFSKINGLELITSRWWRFRWGAILRRERKKGLYKNYFRETPLFNRIFIKLQLPLVKKSYNPAFEVMSNIDSTVFLFTKRAPDDDLFKRLVPFANEIRTGIINLLSPSLKEKAKTLKNPEIAIHVRRGDFKIGNPITPNKFFIDSINIIRQALNKNNSETIFTDAEENEIADILALENVHLASEKEDILDILQMSQSQFLVLSQSSTFSYWAAFLSEAFVIRPHGDWQREIKSSSEKYVEFNWNANDSISTEKLKGTLKKFITV